MRMIDGMINRAPYTLTVNTSIGTTTSVIPKARGIASMTGASLDFVFLWTDS